MDVRSYSFQQLVVIFVSYNRSQFADDDELFPGTISECQLKTALEASALRMAKRDVYVNDSPGNEFSGVANDGGGEPDKIYERGCVYK